MSRRRLFVVLIVCLAVGLASTASAGTTWKKLGANPFHQPSLSSEADLKLLMRDRSVDLQAGFTKAGYPALYPAFLEQFPSAKIDTVKVAPGEHFEWVVFKKKSSGRVAVLEDVTWKGDQPFHAYRFAIDQDGKRHEFLVPYVCGNVALRGIAPIPPAPVATRAPASAPAAPAPVAAPAPLPAAPVAVSAPAPVASKPAPFAAAPAPAARKPEAVLPTPAPVAPKLVAAVPPAPAPVAGPQSGLLFDVGLSRQFDPANYLFARVGYEIPISEKLYVVGLVGGSVRWMGNDGGSAFTADLMLDYHWMDRFSLGGGVGYWSGNDGQADLIADVGYLLSGRSDGSNTSLFLEARLPFDELDNFREFGRLGLGLRFRF